MGSIPHYGLYKYALWSIFWTVLKPTSVCLPHCIIYLDAYQHRGSTIDNFALWPTFVRIGPYSNQNLQGCVEALHGCLPHGCLHLDPAQQRVQLNSLATSHGRLQGSNGLVIVLQESLHNGLLGCTSTCEGCAVCGVRCVGVCGEGV